MGETTIRAARDRVLTPDATRGLLIAGAGLVVVNLVAWRFGLLPVSVVFTAVVLALLLVAWRRYLRWVEFDADSRVIRAGSILPLVSFAFPLTALTAVTTVPHRLSLKRGGGYNLVFRRAHRIQPLLFEVWSAGEDEQAQLLLARVSSALLSVEGALPGDVATPVPRRDVLTEQALQPDAPERAHNGEG